MYTETLSHQTLSLLYSADGTVYNLKSPFQVLDGTDLLLPANKIYTPKKNNRGIYTHNSYDKNFIWHELLRSDQELTEQETSVSLCGKDYFYVDGKFITQILPVVGEVGWWQNDLVSPEASRILDSFQNKLQQKGMDVAIGIYGSHRLSLNHPKSDMDLIAFAEYKNEEEREQLNKVLEDALLSFGFRSIHKTDSAQPHIDRYRERFGVSESTANALANVRIRFVDSEGTRPHISFRSMQNKININLIERIFNPVTKIQIEKLPCEVVDTSNSFDIPGTWTINTESGTAHVVSFSWSHQGMGTFDSDKLHRLSALQVDEDLFFMQDNNHYLLPY